MAFHHLALIRGQPKGLFQLLSGAATVSCVETTFLSLSSGMRPLHRVHDHDAEHLGILLKLRSFWHFVGQIGLAQLNQSDPEDPRNCGQAAEPVSPSGPWVEGSTDNSEDT
jgi:hypothetical protein